MSNALNLKTPLTTINLGGKDRTIKFDLNAYAELELKYGSVEKAMDALQTGSVSALRNILWAGLIHSEAVFDTVTGDVVSYAITPYQVGSWIEPSDMQAVSTSLSEAIIATLPLDQRNAAQKEIDRLANEQESKNEKNEQDV